MRLPEGLLLVALICAAMVTVSQAQTPRQAVDQKKKASRTSPALTYNS